MAVASNLMHAPGHEGERQGSPESSQPSACALSSAATDLNVGVLFDRLLDAVVIARLTTGRIVLWNAAAEKLFGYTAEEAIGKSIEVLMPEPITHIHRAGLERYRRTGHGLIIDADAPVEMPARTKQGDELRVELALSELRDSRGDRFALAVIRDAMHHKQLELTHLELVQARVARSEAETALGGRDELLETVAATLASEPTPDDLGRLISALADFRRIHRGELSVRTMEAELVDVVHAASDAARRRASRRRILVYTPPSAPALVDLARFRQVLDQVIDEAILHTHEGARIEIRLDVPSPTLVSLTVRTQGSGEPRLAGVGLQLSRTLMQHQGGTLTCEVSSSGSLEVTMTLPGSPRPMRRKTRRPRTPGRATPIS